MKKLPVLISIPHGGDIIPKEVEGRVVLGKEDIFFDGDAKTGEIYSFHKETEFVLENCIARAIVDVNREPNDLPPGNPDGVIKTITPYKKSIYIEGKEPDGELICRLLENYYYPYHSAIKDRLEHGNIKFAFDCHSMLAFAPAISHDAGKERPVICLSNNGNEKGGGEETTCDAGDIIRLAGLFRKMFKGDVLINSPFTGGNIIKHHSKKSGVPWIQIEINRNLYLADKYFDRKILAVNRKRLKELREMMFEVISGFAEGF